MKKSTSKKNPGGRPAFTFDSQKKAELDKLLAMQADDTEVAAWFGITVKTIWAAKKRDPVFADHYNRGRERGRASLRRMMWQTAQGAPPHPLQGGDGEPVLDAHENPVMVPARPPSVSMQIFLAKNLLGMSDKQELTGAEGEPPPAPNIIVISESAKQLTEKLIAGGEME